MVENPMVWKFKNFIALTLIFKDCYSNCHVPHAVILYTIFNVYHHALVIWTVHNVMLDSDGQLLLHAHTLELSQLLQEIFLLSIDFFNVYIPPNHYCLLKSIPLYYMTSSLLPVSNPVAIKMESTRSEKTEPETKSDRGAEDERKSTCSDEPKTHWVDTVHWHTGFCVPRLETSW